ncbi:MAG: hypothetical protein ACTSPD_10030 [Promethearchaeota archaeon]
MGRNTKNVAGDKMKIRAVSRREALIIKPEEGEILISIYSSGDSKPEFKETWKDILFLEFDDIDDPKCTHGLKLFTQEQARIILAFVDMCKPNAITVHCDAGISRSVGVMLALDYIYNNENRYNDKRYSLYNRYVSSLLLKERYDTK